MPTEIFESRIFNSSELSEHLRNTMDVESQISALVARLVAGVAVLIGD
jgi:hypothetical protein